MKGKIRSIVALLSILMLVVTLAPLANTELATAAPTLDMWEVVTTPGAAGTNTVVASDVNGMAVCPDGMTIYVIDNQPAGVANDVIWKSTNGGRTFAALITAAGIAAQTSVACTGPFRYVAVAPDYSPTTQVVAVVDSFAPVAGTNALGRVYVSNDGGVNWVALPLTPDAGAGLNRVMDLAIGPARDTDHPDLGRDYAVVTAADIAAYTSDADIFVIGQTTAWTAVGTAVAGANVFDYTSVAFTPCFLVDRVVVAVGSNAAGTFLLLINLGAQWGGATCAYVTPPGGPVLIQATPIDFAAGAVPNSIISSDIALPACFTPTTPDGQRTFVGMAAVGATANTDVFRIDFTIAHKLFIATDVDINSISYSGDCNNGTLIAGASTLAAGPNMIQTWYSNDPCTAYPTWIGSSKPPTGTVNAIVICAPDFPSSQKVFAGTSDAATAGNESAFSVSTTGGICFNQTALIDTAINGMSDVMPTPAGTEIFLATWNAATGAALESLWKSPLPCTAESWDRIRISPANWGNTVGGTIIRLSPGYGTADSTLFWCDRGAVGIQYSSDGGCVFLSRNTLPTNIVDVTVEDALILYAACSDNKVYRSGSAAWDFGSQADPGIGPINMIAMAATYPNLPEAGHVLVGGVGPAVACFTPWPTFTTLTTGLGSSTMMQVAGDTDYGINHIIYAGSINGKVYRWDIDTSITWEEINPTIASFSGLAVRECLYAADATLGGGVYRTSNPTAPTPLWAHLTTGLSGGEAFNAVPSALRCSGVPATSYVALFAIDTANAVLYEYIDTRCKALEEGLYIYSVKFVCGKGAEKFGVEPARYATAINIHNYHDEAVTLKKKVVVAHREGEPVGEVTEYFELSLGPNEAVEVDCVDIYGLLGAVAPAFIKGFVVIESPQPLNIVAVYTVKGLVASGGMSIDVEQILPVVSP